MFNNIRKIDHQGEEYVSLADVLELVEHCNDLTHFEIMISGDSEEIECYEADLDLEKEEPPFLKAF